jgi:hypothetical protein
MGKYSPLGEFLRKQKGERVALTFAEIERIVGAKLPRSQRYPAWWSNNPWNNVMTQVWLDAGFETEQVDVEGRKLVFRKVGKPQNRFHETKDKLSAGSKPHPAYGWMRGTFTIAPGVDLTEPADPHWGEVAYGDKTWDDLK